MRRLHFYAALCAILLAAAALRGQRLGEPSYWLDEFFSLQASNGLANGAWRSGARQLHEPPPRFTQLDAARPWSAIGPALRTDNHPPLYFALLRLWRIVLGDGEAATRSLSCLASLAALWLLAEGVRLRHGGAAGLLGALLMAVSPVQVEYAREARGYALATAFVVGAAVALARLQRHGPHRRRSVALGLAALGALATHYYAAGPLLGLGVYALVALRGAPRRAAVAGLLLALALFVAAWGPVLLAQRGHVYANNSWVFEPSAGHVALTLSRLFSLPASLLAPSVSPRLAPTAAALLWLTMCVAAWRRPGARLWLAWWLGGVLFVTAVDLTTDSGQLNVLRYTFFVAPALLAMLAALAEPAAQSARRWNPAGAGLALAVAVSGLGQLPGVHASNHTPWREFARLLDRAAHAGEPIVVANDAWLAGREAYRALLHYAWAPRRAFVLTTGPPSASVLEELRRRAALWLVVPFPLAVAPSELFPSARVEERIEWPDVAMLYRLSLRAK